MIQLLVALAALLPGHAEPAPPMVPAPPMAPASPQEPMAPMAHPQPARASAPSGPGLGGRHGFLENRGQWPQAARFRTLGGGPSAWFVDTGWWLVLRGPESGAALELSFEDARTGAPSAARPNPVDQLGGRHHFLAGHGAERAPACRAYGTLRWGKLFEGIDLVVRATSGGAQPTQPTPNGNGLFAYDLMLDAGAELERVAVRVEGHLGLAIDAAGQLVIETAAGPLVQTPPVAWQVTPAGPLRFSCRFRLLDDDRFGFEAPGRDLALPAVVDPALIFSTYLSGNGEQTVEQLELASNGDVLAAGTTNSDAFPTTPGAFQGFAGGEEDVFITRMSAAGALLWSTYLNGSESDILRGFALDAADAPTLCGDTRSTDFPTTPGAFDPTPNGFVDGFCAQLAPSGDALLFGTYLGGALNDRAADLALDASGAITVVGATNGAGFPVVAGSYDTTFNGGVFAGDGFCLRLDPSGAQLLWSTYIGGSSDDGATAVGVESTGEVTVAGVAGGSFPMSSGAFDTSFQGPAEAWVLRLDAAGQQRVYSTWLGGSGLEEILRVVVDGSGASILLGWTEGADYPVTAGALDGVFGGVTEGFLTRLNATGTALEWSTFIGGPEDDELTALALDPSGALVVVGNSSSDTLVTTPGAYDTDFNASLFGLFRDVYVLKLAPIVGGVMAIDYATYFGTQDDDAVYDVALDASGAAVLCGSTTSFGFPTTVGAYQPSFNASSPREGFVSKLAFLRHPIHYGQGTPPGAGGSALIDYSGFPDLASDDFRLSVNNAAPKQKAILFHGFAAQSSPFYSGTMLVKPPLFRHRPEQTDSFGYKLSKVAIDPSWVGQTVYFQWWIKDPPLKKKTGLSDALEVLFHP